MRNAIKINLQEDKINLIPAAIEQIPARLTGPKSRIHLNPATIVLGSNRGLEEQNKDPHEPKLGCNERLL